MLYKRIAAASELETLRELRVEVIDRFGLLPEPAARLFDLTAIGHAAGRLGIEKFNLGPGGGTVVFAEKNPVPPERIISLLKSAPGRYRMTGSFTLNICDGLADTDARIACCRELIAALDDREAKANP
ncbi:MAG: hypothetical protein M5U09_26055 [Gammaproteobacteria bacterium]|nr:hypothetical protein [Gammaproteobacteria bacterium]